MATSPQATVHSPVPPPLTSIPRSERSLAPDIARGAMLLFIAIANVAIYLHGHSLDDYNHIADAAAFDRVALFIEQLLIAERSRPMFAILYGFGMAVMASRMFGRGMDAKGVRKILRRRSWWLIAFGFVHATFLFYGDILAPYGATGLIALFFVHLSDRSLRRWLWGSSIYVVVVSLPVFAFFYTAAPEPVEFGLPPYVEQLLFGPIASIAGTLTLVLLALFIPLVIVGIMIQRGGWIDHPRDHLPQLKKTFASGMVVNVLSSLPFALIGLGAWHPSNGMHMGAAILTVLGGMYAGLGYICGFALLAHRLSDYGRKGLPGALAAVGERSLTCYLCQSFIMAPLLAVWGLGLGDGMGYLAAYGVAAGTWALTVVLAVSMSRAGVRGPFEVLLRRLTYGRDRTT
ncbi:DUF418 domain-containing protein [Glycomyces sp. L485]|uniref:DUF418 domain-containing protein n=1 Tax=Glycomyces sp. L485 TaxID=2909235 RepID=UPI001F4AA072|nr:DUF418 domain-containing protein [Glycomyces sp. L485]MCH7230164.1 DUF418 domain-containing protein [Glycomyces sp. L485]